MNREDELTKAIDEFKQELKTTKVYHFLEWCVKKLEIILTKITKL